ncbi:hypothetical protein PBV87_02540 [Niameybacter massiliensis]|uniref:Uncharacterized protein n=1 Tax=Holtiella tumoricola TaxID=3018743 RepID=A0AA42IZT2_9FIRM|nr:hypothetical protein [Holtiella tumoricola]MDA3730383.1 hypothetical protein [Holtiella tumoricola]
MMKQLDTLKYTNDEVIFVKANGEELKMPNLTALTKLYYRTDDADLKERIKAILEHDIASLLIAEIMIDMQNDRVQERLQTGEISKNMGHVGTYNIILESHREQAEILFNELVAKGELSGTFEEVLFATFPCGLVVERAKFPQYENKEYVVEIL